MRASVTVGWDGSRHVFGFRDLDLPAVGYGLRYDFGIFKPNIKNGYPVEQPEEWLKHRYPWEIPHPEFQLEVQFGGHIEIDPDPKGRSGIGSTQNPSSGSLTISLLWVMAAGP